MNPNDLLRLDAQLCFLLYATTRAVTQAYAPVLDPLGLTYPQYLVMLVLWEEDGLTLKQIGERLQLDSGTLTPLLKRMETAGLLVRQRSLEDERAVIVTLTPAGRKLRGKATGVPMEIFCRTGLSSTSADRLSTDLRRILESLRGGAEGPGRPRPDGGGKNATRARKEGRGRAPVIGNDNSRNRDFSNDTDTQTKPEKEPRK